MAGIIRKDKKSGLSIEDTLIRLLEEAAKYKLIKKEKHATAGH
jgi:hypothetical protein